MNAMRSLTCLVVLGLAVFSAPPSPAVAQDLEGCDSFQRYVEREDYPRALEELTWCQRSIEDLHFEKVKSIISRPILGYEPAEVTVEGAFGLATVEALYSNGSDEVTLAITGGGSAAEATSGLGALAGLANAFGVRTEGTSQVRVAGFTGQLEETDDGVSLMLTMDGGTIVTIDGSDAETVEAFAEEILPDLEDYLG